MTDKKSCIHYETCKSLYYVRKAGIYNNLRMACSLIRCEKFCDRFKEKSLEQEVEKT